MGEYQHREGRPVTRRACVRTLAAAGVGLAGGTRLLGATSAAGRPGNATELLIRGGRLVNASGSADMDVRIVDGTITEVGAALRAGPGARVIEAAGKLVMPEIGRAHV